VTHDHKQTSPRIDTLLAEVQWNAQGLVPAIAQDASSGTVLMLAWMNAESLRATLDAGYAVYWSRSRGKLWRKGESSGNVQQLVDLALDCDGDALLLRVNQQGAACHTGRRHCFFRSAGAEGWAATVPVMQDPATLYGNKV
jgi:phosphoribosyl-AMP cyclohydrolase